MSAETTDTAAALAALDDALVTLRAADDADSAHEACDQFLWAVGDTLRGCYQPIVLQALPRLAEILASGGRWSQRAVLEALIDLGGPFVPAPGFEYHEGLDVRAALRAFLQQQRAQVLALASGSDATADSAREVLELIDDLIEL